MRSRRRTAVTAAVLAGAVVATVGVAQLRTADAAPMAAAASTITVDTDRQFGNLRKAGLGTLFGVAAAPDTPHELMIGSQRYLSQHQSAQGDASYPTSTEAVVGKLRGTDVKMIGRYNDLMGGWPYDWKGTADWYSKVDSATRSIQSYKDVLLAVAPFNEPDNKLQGGFAQDAAVPGNTYDEKFNWLWTQTFRRIRAIDPTVPIMGPNYEFYLGWQPELQTKMRDFLVNARNTGTVPNMIGWHNLGPSPGDVPETLSRYYRPLENELGIPGRPLPVVIEEYGSGAAKDFEGVPGSMIKHWAEFERYDVDHAMMGIYTNPGLLGNTLRRTPAGLKPNAGWQMMAWYKAMTGTRVDVSRWDTRRFLASDGVAGWDDELRTVQILVGGEDNDVDVRVLGLARRGLTGNVRVRVDSAVWTVDPLATDRNVQAGGDWQSAPLDLPDSAVEFAVEAPMTGTYRLEVGYANGTTATSTHQVYVNGAAAGTVSYPSTGAWFDGPTQDRAGRIAPVTVQLNAGTNRIRLQKGAGYAELDYVELKKTDA
ncbi:CBM35 domain-containing protein [Dactylosporangium sp. NPDC005555]|uniref:CBM35 domain-containing protein n=1 Tax=Dactylosporangium sp. NPDC005555 TaxID=3154889 RepID=UPI0033A2EA7D